MLAAAEQPVHRRCIRPVELRCFAAHIVDRGKRASDSGPYGDSCDPRHQLWVVRLGRFTE
jgi:hypothetical protein